MRTIPEHSTYTTLGGMWFIFRTNEHALALWISSLTGKEELYVNGELQATKRAISLSSTHTVEIGRSRYTVALSTRQLKEGRFECTLSRDGEFVQGFATQYIYKRSATTRLVTIAASTIVTLAVLQAGLSPWYLAVLVVIVGITLALPTSGKGFVINEMPIPVRSSDA